MVNVSRTDCTFQVSDTPTLILAGSIDAAYAGQYSNVVIVENQMVATANPTTLMTETSGVQLYEAEVQVLDPSQNNGALAKYSTPVAGFADPAMSGQAGSTGSEVLMIDAGTIAILAARVQSQKAVQQVVSSVIIKGRTLGGLEVHTQEFLFPVSVFYGTTCGSTGGMACISAMSQNIMNDCRLGLDENTPCQNIAANLGRLQQARVPRHPSQALILDNAHCPTPHPAPTAPAAACSPQPQRIGIRLAAIRRGPR